MESYFPKKYFPDRDDPTKDPLRDHCDVIIEELGELIGMIRCTKCITHRMNKLNRAHAKLRMSEECYRVSIQYHNTSFSLNMLSSLFLLAYHQQYHIDHKNHLGKELQSRHQACMEGLPRVCIPTTSLLN